MGKAGRPTKENEWVNIWRWIPSFRQSNSRKSNRRKKLNSQTEKKR